MNKEKCLECQAQGSEVVESLPPQRGCGKRRDDISSVFQRLALCSREGTWGSRSHTVPGALSMGPGTLQPFRER